MPERIWVTPVLPEKQSRFHDRLTGSGPIPPYADKAAIVVTLADLPLRGTALTSVVDKGAVEGFELVDWLGQSPENESDLRVLLNGLLHRHLQRLGCENQKGPGRYFLNTRGWPMPHRYSDGGR